MKIKFNDRFITLAKCFTIPKIFKDREDDLRSNYIVTAALPILPSTPYCCLDRSAVEDNFTSTGYIGSNDKMDNKTQRI